MPPGDGQRGYAPVRSGRSHSRGRVPGAVTHVVDFVNGEVAEVALLNSSSEHLGAGPGSGPMPGPRSTGPSSSLPPPARPRSAGRPALVIHGTPQGPYGRSPPTAAILDDNEWEPGNMSSLQLETVPMETDHGRDRENGSRRRRSGSRVHNLRREAGPTGPPVQRRDVRTEGVRIEDMLNNQYNRFQEWRQQQQQNNSQQQTNTDARSSHVNVDARSVNVSMAQVGMPPDQVAEGIAQVTAQAGAAVQAARDETTAVRVQATAKVSELQAQNEALRSEASAAVGQLHQSVLSAEAEIVQTRAQAAAAVSEAQQRANSVVSRTESTAQAALTQAELDKAALLQRAQIAEKYTAELWSLANTNMTA